MAPSSPDPSPAAGQVPDGPSEENAYLLFEQLRWSGRPPTCPHCRAADRSYLLRPAAGVRRTRTGAVTARRVWKCGACRMQYSVLTGTVLQGTRVPLTAWIRAVELLGNSRDGEPASATDVTRGTGVGREAARHIIARWRAAAQVEPLRTVLSGTGQLFQG